MSFKVAKASKRTIKNLNKEIKAWISYRGTSLSFTVSSYVLNVKSRNSDINISCRIKGR